MAKGYVVCRFFCLNCGHEGIPLPRKISKQKKSFHRKKLYCANCQCTVNHIECKTEKDIEKFHNNFAIGKYQEEALKSIEYIKQESEVIK